MRLGPGTLPDTVGFWAFNEFFRLIKFRFINNPQVFVIFIHKDFVKILSTTSLLNFIRMKRGVQTQVIY
jgi:hypothetical protein